jgi:hypothetical protein
VEYCTHALKKSAIERLGYAVMLWRVVGSKTSLSALASKEVGEVAAGIFTAAIGSKSLDVRAVLSLRPGRERLVSFKRFVLSPEGFESSVTRIVVCEGNIIFAAS